MRKIVVITAGILAASMTLGGCGSGEMDSGEAGEEAAKEEATKEEAESDTAENEVISKEEAESDTSENDVISTDELLAAAGYDPAEYVTLPDDYLDFTIEVSSDYIVSDDTAREYIEENILPNYPAYIKTDKTVVEDGDIVDIDFVGTLDGEEFDGGSAESYKLTIGSGNFVEGFEEGLIGQEAGETADIELTFPEDYFNEDLAGRDVVFEVTVNGIVEEETLTGFDEVTDDYVKDTYGLIGLTTTDELLENMKTTLEVIYETSRQNEIESKVLDQLLEKSKVDYPEELLDERVDNYMEAAGDEAEDYDMDEEEYEEYIRDVLESYLVEQLILEAIAEDLGITATEEEFDAFVDYYVVYYLLEDAEEFYDYYGGKEYVMLSYAESAALDRAIEATTVILPDGSTKSGAEMLREDILS